MLRGAALRHGYARPAKRRAISQAGGRGAAARGGAARGGAGTFSGDMTVSWTTLPCCTMLYGLEREKPALSSRLATCRG